MQYLASCVRWSAPPNIHALHRVAWCLHQPLAQNVQNRRISAAFESSSAQSFVNTRQKSINAGRSRRSHSTNFSTSRQMSLFEISQVWPSFVYYSTSPDAFHAQQKYELECLQSPNLIFRCDLQSKLALWHHNETKPVARHQKRHESGKHLFNIAHPSVSLEPNCKLQLQADDSRDIQADHSINAYKH